jgi:chromosome segregation ATPase
LLVNQNHLIDMLLEIFLSFAEFVKTYVAALKETIANLQAQLEAVNAGELLTKIAALEAELASTKQELADALSDDAADKEAIAVAQADADAQQAKAEAALIESETAKATSAKLAEELATAVAAQESLNSQLITKINDLQAELMPSS